MQRRSKVELFERIRRDSRLEGDTGTASYRLRTSRAAKTTRPAPTRTQPRP